MGNCTSCIVSFSQVEINMTNKIDLLCAMCLVFERCLSLLASAPWPGPGPRSMLATRDRRHGGHHDVQFSRRAKSSSRASNFSIRSPTEVSSLCTVVAPLKLIEVKVKAPGVDM